MKLPSIFRTPRHQRFHIEPRYYDPIKEEMEQRIARIKSEIRAGNGESLSDGYQGSLRGAFTSKRGVRGKKTHTTFLQTLIFVLLVGFFWAYYEFGNAAFYGFILLLPVYWIVRRKLI